MGAAPSAQTSPIARSVGLIIFFDKAIENFAFSTHTEEKFHN